MFCAVGEVPEWLKGPVLKTGVRASVPWVRIPPSPPNIFLYQLLEGILFMANFASSVRFQVKTGQENAFLEAVMKFDASQHPGCISHQVMSFPPKTGPLFLETEGGCDGSETSFRRGRTEAPARD